MHLKIIDDVIYFAVQFHGILVPLYQV